MLLPASGQTYDRTFGETSSGAGLAVGVFANIPDAQLAKNTHNATYNSYPPASPPFQRLASGITTPDELSAGDIAYLGEPLVSTQYTYFGTTLHVSNDEDAFNTILITVESSRATANTDGCAEATVRSGRGSVTVQMPLTADTPTASGDTYYQAFVRILDPRDEDHDYELHDGPACIRDDPNTADVPLNYADGIAQADLPRLLARHGETVTVSVQGAGQVSLRVDGEGPELRDIKPEHQGSFRSGRVDFSFEVRDDDSGLRHDGELVVSADGDLTQFNGDRDHNTSGEPITVRSSGQVYVSGRTQDIDVEVGRSTNSNPDITDRGRWTLVGDRPGVAYAFSAPGNNMDEGDYRMLIRARDRTGNETVAYASFDDNDAGQPYTFTLDDTDPRVVQVWAGVSYDTREEKEVSDRSYIMVDFGEALRPGIDPERFTVAGHRVVGIIHPSYSPGDDKPIGIDGHDFDPRSRVYLELARELESNETPDLLLFGGIVYDLAGNPNDSEDVTRVIDSVAPRFSVGVRALAEGETLTSAPAPAAQDEDDPRPVVNGRGEFVVDVRSDEELRRRPTVYFVAIETEEEQTSSGRGTGDLLYSIHVLKTGSALTEQEDPLHWRRAYKASSLTGLGEMIGVIVYAVDEESNAVASPGWSPETLQGGPPSAGDPLDLAAMHKAGLLVEVDTEFNGEAKPDLRVTPRRGQENDETESARPLIALRFPDEATEYALCPTGGCGDENPDAEYSDSHPTVRITEITLNGNDASGRLSRVDDAQFAVQAGNLAQGRHEVAYTAVDTAGNEVDGEFSFSVLARGAYELEVSPGWNLISLPGNPADPSLSAVIPPFGNVTAVMSYQDGNWLTAAVDNDGDWRGSLVRIEAGYGYWVFATSFDTLAPLIPETDPTSVPLTVPVVHGWNLVGVVDVFQNPAGTAPGAEGGGSGEADGYFSSIDWRVAYSYNPQYGRFTRVSHEDDVGDEESEDDEPPEIVNGKGYWVWAAEPGTLVP